MEVIQISPAALELYFDKAIRDLTDVLIRREKENEKTTFTSPSKTINYYLQTLKQTLIKG